MTRRPGSTIPATSERLPGFKYALLSMGCDEKIASVAGERSLAMTTARGDCSCLLILMTAFNDIKTGINDPGLRSVEIYCTGC